MESRFRLCFCVKGWWASCHSLRSVFLFLVVSRPFCLRCLLAMELVGSFLLSLPMFDLEGLRDEFVSLFIWAVMVGLETTRPQCGLSCMHFVCFPRGFSVKIWWLGMCERAVVILGHGGVCFRGFLGDSTWKNLSTSRKQLTIT